jgi:3-hydroxyisobutyrate dehydrogenase-like beta-hydroxyacid dehydrogenase
MTTDTTRDDAPSAPRSVDQIGLIGCGRMGVEMAGHLVSAGWSVRAADPSEDALERAAARGALPASNAEVAAASDLVLVVVVDDAQVRAVLEGADGSEGILAAARPGTTIAICASVHPETCRELEVRGRAHDVHVVDVALVGGERGAEQANMTLLCGGDRGAIAQAEAAFAAMATTVIHVGDVGAGQVAKTANNVLMWAALRIDVEALRLARAYGVAPGVLRPVLRAGTGANRPLEEWGMHRLRWPTKDLEVATQMAADVGLEVPLIEQLIGLMQQLDVADLHDLR